eukprot:TRINITY_DN1886_c0_g1_i1.p1 TRINITY_DN1886_c0_g1~~TRINITY_DN1886_c0_g1_i1.p1  ORF type:complete len:650 (+),score=200.56 TRINITY_DN1886_c0_g1_i1:280-2229(+)
MSIFEKRRLDGYSGLFNHFYNTVTSSNRGKVLLFIYGGSSILSTVVGFAKRLKRRTNEIKIEEIKDEKKPVKKITSWKNVFPILKKFSKIEGSYVIIFHCVGIIVGIALRVYLTIKIATMAGSLGKLIGEGKFDKMFDRQVTFALFCMPAAFVNAFLMFLKSNLAVRMRGLLTKLLHGKYMKEMLYYKITHASTSQEKAGEVVQKMTEDLREFTDILSELFMKILRPIAEIIFVSRSLGKLMGWQQLVGFYAFFFIAGFWVKFVSPDFSWFHKTVHKLEGELRLHHNRIATSSEQIAFYNGGKREENILQESWDRIENLENRHQILHFIMSTYDTYIVKYGGTMFAYSMLIPAVYFGRNGIEKKTTAQTMQYYLTATQLFISLGTACKHLLLSYKEILAMSGMAERVNQLFSTLKSARKELKKEKESKGEVIIGGDSIIFEDADIVTPDGTVLSRNLSFSVTKNTNVLVTGKNGCGKSSMFRTLAGLWPLKKGKLTRPSDDKIFYIPQNPYMVPGTLRDQITYPIKLKNNSQDKHLADLLEMVGVTYLIEREGFDTVKNWLDVLSGGEKQRIAMARLFYHKPAYGILDESTSAMSKEIERSIYENCRKMGITIFTVSHKVELDDLHDYQLEFKGEGEWEWRSLKSSTSN